MLFSTLYYAGLTLVSYFVLGNQKLTTGRTHGHKQTKEKATGTGRRIKYYLWKGPGAYCSTQASS